MIDITIPVLNEEATLERQVHHLHSYLDAHLAVGDVHIVIADNGSTDCTATLATTLSNELPGVRALSVGQRGVGRALKASWGRSTADIVGYMDLDFSTALKHLGPAFDLLLAGEADFVNGSRLAPGAVVRERTMGREVTSRVFNRLVRTYFGTSFTDGMCGFKFLRRAVADDLVRSGATSDGWFFATQLLVLAEDRGVPVRELPVEWTHDPNSKVAVASLSWEYLKEMRSLKRHLAGSR